ncbi:MAG TPA: cell division protein ZipA C-terminal FtsZ-binding domain-containing protein [Burkholderiaceae bacterium]|nr:cell division protein ZipA C-terminal FtsZ-binding domain-containing protein [Burkholderiaceae bacterium]
MNPPWDNTLWASLAALAAIAIAVVVVFNLLQGRQRRLRDAWRERLAGRGEPAAGSAPRAEPARAPAPVPAPAPAAPAERVEPTFGGIDPARPAGADGPVEPAFAAHDDEVEAPVLAATTEADDDAPPDAGPAPSAPPARQPGPVLDPRLDCVVAFSPDAPVAAERLLGAISTLRRAGSKPIAIEADTGDGHWTVPSAASAPFRRVRAGVLLATRPGPLNAMEFSEFTAAMQTLGRAIGDPDVAMPDMRDVLEHARQLDETCALLDAVIGLNVETPQALSPAELAALAGGLGLVERGNNRFAALGDDGEVLFSLALGDRAEQLTLLLDVPRAPAAAEPWGRMVGCAMLCAERTGGRVVDDVGRPLTEAAAIEVARQLDQRYRRLQEAGLDAGSPAALRVFH